MPLHEIFMVVVNGKVVAVYNSKISATSHANKLRESYDNLLNYHPQTRINKPNIRIDSCFVGQYASDFSDTYIPYPIEIDNKETGM